MKKLIVLNWKMNPTSLTQALKLVQASDQKNFVVCPPFVFLTEIKKRIKKAQLGAQNCFSEKQGAFTGEVSAQALKSIGCRYVIIGHSERRKLFQETNKEINQKIKNCLSLKIKPILCVGSEKRNQSAEKEIEKQLEQSLDSKSYDVVVAYEPIWAISTNKGIVPGVEETKRIQKIIREKLVDIFGAQKAHKIKILYGGSVDSGNIDKFITQVGMDGVLVGAASLKKKEIKLIAKKYGFSGN
jgi:triosephosphate isomerase (TIM)